MLNLYRKLFQNSKLAKRSTKTNLLIFIIITLTSGWIGVLADRILTEQPEGYSIGMGIWLVLPLLCAIIFRIRENEWKSFGLAPHIKTGWKGYAVAIFIYPVITIITILLVACLGCADISMISWITFISGAVTSLVGSFIKNIFEEFAWRGYLTPRLLERGRNDWMVYGISGLVWGLWHTAYYMVFLGDEYFLTSSRLQTLISAIIITFTESILFVELYRMTNSVWPCVILHSMQNAIPAALVATGAFIKCNGWRRGLLDPMTGILSVVIPIVAGLIIRKWRIALDNSTH